MFDHDEVSEDDTNKENDLKENTEEIFSNIDDTDQIGEEENTWDFDEAIQNHSNKDQDDENASDSENIIQTSLGPIVISQNLSENKFDEDSVSKNV